MPPWLRKVARAVNGKVDETVLGEIVDGQVKKAVAGNTQAATFVLDLYAAVNTAVPEQPIQTTGVVIEGESKRRSIQKEITKLLQDGQARTPGQIAAMIGQDEQSVRRVLKTAGSYRKRVRNRDEWELEPQLRIKGG